MRILLPIDISDPAKNKEFLIESVFEQMDILLGLNQSKDCEIHLLYVNEVWPSYENVLGLTGQFADDWNNQLNKKANEFLAKVKQNIETKYKKVSFEIVSGPAAMMIETIARDEQFDMTILTPGVHSTAEKVLIGSVSGKVVKHGPGTVLLIRPLEKTVASLQNVIIGIDGSSNAQEAMLRAVKQFKLERENVQIILLHSVDLPDPVKFFSPVEFVSKVEQNLLMEGETYLANAKQELASLGLKKVDLVLKEGKPAQEILKLANSLPADLIILGAEGKSAVQHFLLGSVSHNVALHAQCAVAILKREHKPIT